MVRGEARVTIGDTVSKVQENNSVFIPVETKHRLENTTKEDITITEVQYGAYLGEDDIERYDDIYGRK